MKIFFEKLFTIIVFIPIAGMLLYTIFYPKDAALLGKRWQFKNADLQPSDEIIKYNRIVGIISLIFVTLIFLLFLFRGC